MYIHIEKIMESTNLSSYQRLAQGEGIRADSFFFFFFFWLFLFYAVVSFPKFLQFNICNEKSKDSFQKIILNLSINYEAVSVAV